MTCDELIRELELLKYKGFGDAEVLGINEESLEYVEEQKLFKTKHPFLDCINYNTEDLNEYYLEDMYIQDDLYNEKLISISKAIKIY